MEKMKNQNIDLIIQNSVEMLAISLTIDFIFLMMKFPFTQAFLYTFYILRQK